MQRLGQAGRSVRAQPGGICRTAAQASSSLPVCVSAAGSCIEFAVEIAGVLQTAGAGPAGGMALRKLLFKMVARAFEAPSCDLRSLMNRSFFLFSSETTSCSSNAFQVMRKFRIAAGQLGIGCRLCVDLCGGAEPALRVSRRPAGSVRQAPRTGRKRRPFPTWRRHPNGSVVKRFSQAS